MASLTITSNSVSNPLTLDLTKYMNVQRDAGMDVSDPAFSERVWARSLLKEGATLALESLHEKELLFPLELNATTLSAVLTLIQQINQVVTTPGATCSWQPDGASQATTFDVLSGQVDVEYDFRREGQKWTSVKLRIFTQPLGRTASPRRYATASGVGPLLMISPYASGGALTVGASTQAGVAGFGGGTASTGVFYWGQPSLAGDARAQLQISYVAPLPASSLAFVPTIAVSLLPDKYYQPLLTAGELNPRSNVGLAGVAFPLKNDRTVVASQFVGVVSGSPAFVTLPTLLGASSGVDPTVSWAGQHRMFGLARASNVPGYLQTYVGGAIPAFTATVTPGDWTLYDLGTYGIRASEPPPGVAVTIDPGPSSNATIDLNAVFVLPDAATMYLNSAMLNASTYGIPSYAVLPVAFTNTLALDDVLGDQFVYAVPSQSFAPSPIGMAASSSRVTQFTRGLMPRPDPKQGLPILAILGMAPWVASPTALGLGGSSWPNPQNLRTMAQVNVLESARYVLP